MTQHTMMDFARTLSTVALAVVLSLSLTACGGDESPDAASPDTHMHEDGSTHSHGEEDHAHEHADTSETRLDTSGMDGEMDSEMGGEMHEDHDGHEDGAHTHDDDSHSHGGEAHSHN